MRFYLTKTPLMIKQLFARYTWCFSTSKREIYLTFDDGPIPEVTEFVLNQLKKFNATATFFCIGENIQKHPTIFKEIIAHGHSVGNHTFHHLNGWKTSTEEYIDNVIKTELLMRKNEKITRLFRPPYGKIKRSQASILLKKNYKIIMWSIISADFDKKTSKEQCVENVIKKVKNGSVIVFHDSIKARDNLYHTLPIVLENLTNKGYKFKGID